MESCNWKQRFFNVGCAKKNVLQIVILVLWLDLEKSLAHCDG